MKVYPIRFDIQYPPSLHSAPLRSPLPLKDNRYAPIQFLDIAAALRPFYPIVSTQYKWVLRYHNLFILRVVPVGRPRHPLPIQCTLCVVPIREASSLMMIFSDLDFLLKTRTLCAGHPLNLPRPRSLSTEENSHKR